MDLTYYYLNSNYQNFINLKSFMAQKSILFSLQINLAFVTFLCCFASWQAFNEIVIASATTFYFIVAASFTCRFGILKGSSSS